jgi:serine/threonine protein phosphatase PrpC
MPPPRSLRLLGRDWTELGPLAVVSLPDGGALALSRGRLPKSYAYTDPNEDAALVVRCGENALLAVADGRFGAAAAERAISAVEAAAQSLISAHGSEFAPRALGLARGISRTLREIAPAQTCLLLAAVRPGPCDWVSFGDCALYRAGGAGIVSVVNGLLVEPGLAGRDPDPRLWCGSFERRPGESIAAVSDGVINFVPDASAIPLLLAGATDDAAAAEALARAALEGGAGDNVAVAVYGGS